MIEGQGPNPPELAQTGLPDKWLRVLSITARAGEVFANRDKALEWLQTPSPALRRATPLHAVETESGCQEVEDILGRIEASWRGLSVCRAGTRAGAWRHAKTGAEKSLDPAGKVPAPRGRPQFMTQ